MVTLQQQVTEENFLLLTPLVLPIAWLLQIPIKKFYFKIIYEITYKLNYKFNITCSSDACISSLYTMSMISEILRFKKSSDNDISGKY